MNLYKEYFDEIRKEFALLDPSKKLEILNEIHLAYQSGDWLKANIVAGYYCGIEVSPGGGGGIMPLYAQAVLMEETFPKVDAYRASEAALKHTSKQRNIQVVDYNPEPQNPSEVWVMDTKESAYNQMPSLIPDPESGLFMSIKTWYATGFLNREGRCKVFDDLNLALDGYLKTFALKIEQEPPIDVLQIAVKIKITFCEPVSRFEKKKILDLVKTIYGNPYCV